MPILNGKIAIITGGTSGIGLAAATRLHQAGATPILVSERPLDQLEQAARTLPGAAGYRCDVRHRAETVNLAQSIAARFGRIDILINCAGLATLDSECAADEHAARLLVEVNLLGTHNMILAVLPAMKAQKSGAIVNLSSAAAIRGPGGQALYAATKAGILALTETFPQELKGHGIRINAICPGAVRTAMTAAVHTPQNAITQAIRNRIADLAPSPDPSGEFVLEPENIANILVFLCSEESWGINGTHILADHGLSTSWSALPPELKALG